MNYRVGYLFALAVAALLAAFLFGFRQGGLAKAAQLASFQQQHAEQGELASEHARAVEHQQADGFAAIDAKFQGDMRYAQALSASTIAGLRGGSLRLSPTWRCPAQRAAVVPAPAADPGRVEAADRLRQESASRIIGDVYQCQAERDTALDLLEAERR